MMTTLVDCRISHCDLEVVDFIMQHISLVFVVDIIYYNIIMFIVAVVDKYVPGFLERHEQIMIYFYICVFSHT